MTAGTVSERAAAEERAMLDGCIEAIALHQDRAAFRTLFDHFAPRLKSYIMRQGTPGPAAEEVIQEVMLKVWQKAHLFDAKKATASTWIFRIARNQRIDSFRKDRRPELDPDEPRLRPQGEPSADDAVSLKQEAGLLREALTELPDEQREVVHLSFYEDMSHSEIADHLGIPLGTVKSRMRLAFRKLALVMEEMESDERPNA